MWMIKDGRERRMGGKEDGCEGWMCGRMGVKHGCVGDRV